MPATRLTSASRPRVMTALFSGAALMNAAMAVASTVSTIVAGDHLGARWGAVPNTAGIVGTGIGALALTALMGRRGRRFGLTCGYLASACGAALACAAVAAGDVVALSTGMLLLGLGNAGAQLSRYAAADLYPAERRGFAIGTVVWAGAVGAVGGPLLLGPSDEVATALGRAPLTGPYALATLAALGAAAAITTIRLNRKSRATPALDVGGGGVVRAPATTACAVPVAGETAGEAAAGAGGVGVGVSTAVGLSGDSLSEDGAAGDGLAGGGAAGNGAAENGAAGNGPAGDGPAGGRAAGGGGVGRSGDGGSPVRLGAMLRTAGARTALAVMVTAQVVMVAVMTAAPLDMHMHGQGLGAVGMTLSAHTFGMFAFSPVTGWLLDRGGARPVMFGGLLTLAVATVLTATAAEGDASLRTGALFLLGYGWNLCFVGGSGRLARDLPASARASVEGAVDAAVWSIAAAASLASTLVLSAGGYAALAWAACALLVLPAGLLLRAE